MNFQFRKMVKPGDLNPNGTLFGGRLLEWIDEQAALYAVIQLEQTRVVTKFMSEINFVSSADMSHIVEIGVEPVKFGRTSLILRAEARNKMTQQTILTIENITFVCLDKNGVPFPHGKTKVEYVKDRLKKRGELKE